MARRGSSGSRSPTTKPLTGYRPFATPARLFSLLLALALSGLGTEAQAQLSTLRLAPSLHAGQTANAFAEWRGAGGLGGVEIEIPPGWTVRGVTAVREGGEAPTPLTLRRMRDGVVRAVPPAPLRGRQHLAVTLEVGPGLGYRSGALTPLDARGWPMRARRVPWERLIVEALPSRNPAFHLGAGGEPVLLRRRDLPSLDPSDPLTVELWLKTTAADEVVLSTWDGEPERPYPLEVVIDGRGRLAVFHGRPGYHESLVSAAPVADGAWHHVALVNDPEAALSRLLLDGVAVDSVRLRDAGTFNTMPLALGGRPLRPGQPHLRPFSGWLDELRLWPGARPLPALRRAMRTPIEALPDGVFYLDFEEPLANEALVRPVEGAVRAPGDLSFAYPVEAFEAEVEGAAVALRWRSRDRRVQEFLVERSTDGQRFETVGAVRPDDRASRGSDGALRFGYTDLPPAGQVLYYRVRQVADSGLDRVSGTLKLGLGERADEAGPVAVFNSPNPFRSATEVAFEVAEAGPVELSVWDVAGSRVAVLVDDTVPAGRHSVRFDGGDLPSGIYVVRLRTEAGLTTHKIALTR